MPKGLGFVIAAATVTVARTVGDAALVGEAPAVRVSVARVPGCRGSRVGAAAAVSGGKGGVTPLVSVAEAHPSAAPRTSAVSKHSAGKIAADRLDGFIGTSSSTC